MSEYQIIGICKEQLIVTAYNGPSVGIHASVCALVAHFLHTLKWLNSSLISIGKTISGENIPILFACRENHPKKCDKTVS